MALNPTDACGQIDQSIPQWKRELIIRRRALGRTLQVGSSSVKLTCPAVVAIVRQPEIVGTTIENVSSKHKNSSPSDESNSTVSSVNQNRLDFHPSTSLGGSVSNMRLLDTCSDVNNLVINGIDVKNKHSEVVSSDLCVNYNLIMGEDKSFNLKNKSPSSRSHDQSNNCSVKRHKTLLTNKGSNEVKNGNINRDEDSSDSSEELQYGPGIVNKLKTKYLSMTLREQKRNLRPSIINLRRATSLENMLDGDVTLNKENKSVICTESNDKTESMTRTSNNRTLYTDKSLGLSSHRAMKFLGNRSLETMKRARSMDTLLKCETKNTGTVKNNFGTENRHNNVGNNDVTTRYSHNKPIASIINENIIIVENLTPGLPNEIPAEENVSSKEPYKLLKSNANISPDRELPPPDLVKQALKIFETSQRKKVKAQSQNNLSKHLSGYANTTSQQSAGNIRSINRTKPSSSKPIPSPKPVLSPEKLRQNRTRVANSPKKSISTGNIGKSDPSSNAHFSSQTNKNIERPQLKLEVVESTNNANCVDLSKCDRTIGLPVTSPKVLSPRSISPIVTVISNNEHFLATTIQSKSKCDNNHHKSGEKNSSKTNVDEIDSRESQKPVPESALENIRRGGISMQFSFQNENASDSKSYLPRTSPSQALNTSLVQQKLENPPLTASIAPLRSHNLPHTKQVGIIRPLVTTKVQSSYSPSSTLTEQEIEKNLINRVKSIEQPISKVVVAIKALPDNVVLGSVSSDVTNKSLSLPRACSNPKSKSQGLWNEKAWHQNQNTIVFNFSDRKEVPDYIENDGLILRGKRERPKPGEGGFILLDSTGDESSTDDAEELLIADPPSPCDVTFEGDNVLINGKSNLKKNPKQVKLKIKFNDEATTMFEYPSEASLVEEELPSQTVAGSSGSGETSSQASASAPSTSMSVPLGGSLGAYTPRQLEVRDWQLGVTPVQVPSSPSAGPSQLEAEDHLKPAPPESTVTWSEDIASDLLF